MAETNRSTNAKIVQSRRTVIDPGDRFGRLIIIKELDRWVYPSGQLHRNFQCLCDCGIGCTALAGDLRSGHKKSCGCLSVETVIKRSSVHSKYGTTEYYSWCGMKQRCLNPKNPAYKNYGGRGITICDRWLMFQPFFDDMGHKPSVGYSIERLDNNGNYELSNCKWATAQEQASNSRKCKYITYNGITDTHAGWDRRLGLSRGIIDRRVATGMINFQAITYKKKSFKAYDVITNELIGEWDNQTKCGEYLGIDNREVHSILSGRRNTTHGYRMEYI